MPTFISRLAAAIASLVVCVALSESPASGAAGNSTWLKRTWQSDDGLADNDIVGTVQTSDGYLWVATHEGLFRFDGVRFREVPLPSRDGGRKRIPRAITLGQGNNIWLGLDGPLALCVNSRGAITQAITNDLPNYQVASIAQDGTGAVWLSYYNHAACRIFDGKAELLPNGNGLPGGGACSLICDSNGQLWFAQSGQVGFFTEGVFQTLWTLPERQVSIGRARAGGVWICAGARLLKAQAGAEPVQLGEMASGQGGMEPTAVFEDRSGAAWVGTTTRGLFRFDGKRFERADTSHRDINSVTEDREGNIWVGTSGGGLDRLRLRVLELQGTSSGLPVESLFSLSPAPDGSLWGVTQNGLIVHCLDGVWTNATKEIDWDGGNASCIAVDHEGALWIGTRNRGLFHRCNGSFKVFDRTEGLTGDYIRALLLDSAGNIWVASDARASLARIRNGKLRVFELPPGSRAVRAMTEDAAGDIWVGTTYGLLMKMHDDMLIDETPHTLSPPEPIRCISAMPDGSVWIGYAGAGIGCWKAGKYSRIGTARGLADDYISQIVPDGRGSLWLAGNRGISQVFEDELADVLEGRSPRLRAIVYGRDEGLPSLQANYGYAPNALRTKDGRIWFTMRTGVAVVHSDRVQDNLVPPPVYVERVLLDGQAMPVAGSLATARKEGAAIIAPTPARDSTPNVAPGHRRIDFEFTALSFVAPENVHFRYRLGGYDEDWLDGGNRREASYGRLPPGNYRFEVLACNNTGVWNESGAAFAFVVLPYFWQTWWFQSVTLGGFVLGLVLLIRYVWLRRLHQRLSVLERQAALYKERARIAKDIHDDLGASLTQIAMLSEFAQQDMDSPLKVSNHISRITGTARQVIKSLDEIVWAVNPRNDTLAHLIDYVGQCTVDFLGAPGIRCRLDLPEHPPEMKISAEVRHNLFLAIKEALHNVVKHADAKEVRLRMSVNPRGLKITMEDDGRGFEKAPDDSRADGLRNMRQRLAEIGGECRIESRPGAGTKVTLDLPLQEHKHEQTA